MDNVCQMNCHDCTLQDGLEAKQICSALQTPMFLKDVIIRLQVLENILLKEPEINTDVFVQVEPKVKTKKSKEDEHS